MSKPALLVIDMLKDFLDEGGALFCGRHARKIIPFIKAKIEEFRRCDNPLMFITDSHKKDDPEFSLFGVHCLEGTEGAKIINELEVKKNDFIIPKRTYDAMDNSKLNSHLKHSGIKEVYLVGVCTSICIMETASSLTKAGYSVNIYKDGVADFDQDKHESALERMKYLYGAKIL